MPESNSTTAGPTGKPAKPYPDFPLTAHPAGVWCKKIRGQLHYFGPWHNPEGALKKYLEQKDALHAGKKPRPDAEAVTVKDVVNAFLNHKQALVDSGQLSPRTWREYKDATDLLIEWLGKRRVVAGLGPEDFAALRLRMTARWGPVRVGNAIQRVRSVFKHAFDAELIPTPLRFGPGFQRPSKMTLRVHRAQQGAKTFAPEEVRRMIAAAGQPLKAMLLLGINCGFGNADCGNLPLSALDLDAAMLDFPRPKTGMPRRCPFWPETVEAVREALAGRPKPKHEEHATLTVITKFGRSWAKETPDGPVSKETRKLLDELHINGGKGLGFYTLRHTFRTVADEAKDQPAADYIMGHEVAHMSAVYRETIADDRLRAVADHVRQWLFSEAPDDGTADDGSKAPEASEAIHTPDEQADDDDDRPRRGPRSSSTSSSSTMSSAVTPRWGTSPQRSTSNHARLNSVSTFRGELYNTSTPSSVRKFSPTS
jgi:integrase